MWGVNNLKNIPFEKGELIVKKMERNFYNRLYFIAVR